MFDIEFGIEFFELLVIKLLTVVCDNGSWETKSANYRFLYKFFSFSFGDLSHWFSLHPFGEVVNGHE